MDGWKLLVPVLPLGGALSQDTKVNATFFSFQSVVKIPAAEHGAELSPEISSNSSYRVLYCNNLAEPAVKP